MNMRWIQLSSLDSEDTEETISYKVMKNIQIVTLSTRTIWGCTLEIDATRIVSNTQNATCGAMRSIPVQMTGKDFFAFSATECSIYLNYIV